MTGALSPAARAALVALVNSADADAVGGLSRGLVAALDGYGTGTAVAALATTLAVVLASEGEGEVSDAVLVAFVPVVRRLIRSLREDEA